MPSNGTLIPTWVRSDKNGDDVRSNSAKQFGIAK